MLLINNKSQSLRLKTRQEEKITKQKKKKFVDPKQYCRYLIDPPVADEKQEYQTWRANELYNCALNKESCIAAYTEDRTTSSDVFEYARPKINERELKKCPLHNIPLEMAKQTIVAKINAERDGEIAELEKRLESLD